ATLFRRYLGAGIVALVSTSVLGQTLNDPSLSISSFVTGLSQPTGFAFLGNNDLFVIEKATGLVKRVQSNVPATVLDLNVQSDSERGLLGIALSPTFASDHFVYLYYSTTSAGADSTTTGNWAGNKLSRFI